MFFLVNLVPFYNLVGKLIELNFQVAVAIPSIANEFSLTVKINSISQTFKDEEEIKFVLNVLKICFEEAEIQIFTDEDACKEWLNKDETNKILLKLDGKKSSECKYKFF
jgi:hypothetical protein